MSGQKTQQTDATNTGNIFLSQEWTWGFHLRKIVHQS